MSMEWMHDPKSWQARPFRDQLEALRNHYCTGPCGQSMSVMTTRDELNRALKKASELQAENTTLRHERDHAEQQQYPVENERIAELEKQLAQTDVVCNQLAAWNRKLETENERLRELEQFIEEETGP